MKIPKSCIEWRKSLEKGNSEELQILKNILDDECVPQLVKNRFFRELSSMKLRTSSYEAIKNAESIIKLDPIFFTCQGVATGPSSFRGLLRIEPGSRINDRISFDKKNMLSHRFGLSLNTAFDDLPDMLVSYIIQEVSKDPITLGNMFRIAWATEIEKVRPILKSIGEVIDRLGLIGFDNEKYVIIIVYQRSDVGHSLHVPRVLDGINNPRFRPVLDCRAKEGRTLPISKPANFGLPEAIHRGCSIHVSSLEMRRLG